MRQLFIAICLLIQFEYSFSQNDTTQSASPHKYFVSLSVSPNYIKTPKGFNTLYRNLKSRIGINSEINFNSYYSNRSLIAIGFAQYTLLYNRDFNTAMDGDFHIKYIEHYVSIPLNYRYYVLKRSKKIELYSGIGIAVNYLYQEHVIQENTTFPNNPYDNFNTTYHNKLDGTSLFISASANCGVNYKITKYFNAFIEPTYAILRNPQVSYTNQISILNCKIGGQYLFGTNKIQASQSDTTKQKKKREHYKWYFMFFMNLGTSGHWGLNPPARYDYSDQIGPITSWEAPVNVNEYSSFYFDFGLNFKFARIGRTFLKTGFEYETFQYEGVVKEFSVTTTNYDQPPYPLVTTSIDQANWHYYYVDRFLSIPISIIIPLSKRNDILSGMDAGIAGNLLIEEIHSGFRYSYLEGKSSGFATLGYLYCSKKKNGPGFFIEPLLKSSLSLWSVSVKMGVVF